MSRSTYYLDSLIPAWLQHDSGYRNALCAHLRDRMAFQGYDIVSPVRITGAPSAVDPPIGMVLVRVHVEVEEFDIDMGEE